ncbi:cytochrome P450 [Pholiota conissans]|uniref:Cytochrome P450 n=1 Tax=Pholiota conissans TaxID=109636 RepID=A0A9P6CQK4_9AGAR|nr:cytochrome P450 [Pholiota conissans]
MSLQDFLPLFTGLLRILSSMLQFGGILVLVYWSSRRLSFYLNPLRKLPYPPGPPPRDFISGNARDLPSDHLWITLTAWAQKYGNVMHLKVFNMGMIVLSSREDAIELMEKRSHNYSDRPSVPMINLMGWDFGTGFKPYGSTWHAHRRLMQQMFKPASSLAYRPVQTEKVHDLLVGLLDSPEDFLTHIKTLSTATIMAIIYGYKVAPKHDEFQVLAEKALEAVCESAYPGTALVNILPFLSIVPAWFPGAGFQRFAQWSKGMVNRLINVPYEYVLTGLAAGTATPCLVASLVENCKTEEDHTLLREWAASGYAAGADTVSIGFPSILASSHSALSPYQTTSALGTFIYAMATHPVVQKKAQEELDRVVGTDRLPNFDDEPYLPYIQAICREVGRWRPVTPLCIFHTSNSDDVYNGCYIPAGTTIVPNIWGMTRDPTKYKGPEEFNPDRFLNADNELNDDEVTYAFGFGRRATYGYSDATILSTFDIRPPKNAAGMDISLADVKYSGGLVSHIAPFECNIMPRSSKSKQLVIDISDSK